MKKQIVIAVTFVVVLGVVLHYLSSIEQPTPTPIAPAVIAPKEVPPTIVVPPQNVKPNQDKG